MTIQKIEAPLVGIFYTQPEPEALPFKAPGDAVSVGDAVGMIEVMKAFMQIKSQADGIFKGYLVEDGESVDTGDAICEIES